MKKVVIIGAGIGGLAAGIRLLQAGYQVQIFEKNEIPGGKAAGNIIEGFPIDTGPTILRSPQLLIDLMQSVGADPDRLRLEQVDPQYRFFLQNSETFTIHQNSADTIKSIKNIAPDDADRYTEFLAQARLHYQNSFSNTPVIKSPDSGKALLSQTNLPFTRSLFQMAGAYFTNPSVQSAFSFYPLFFGQNPLFAPERISLLHALENQWGIVYPAAGMSSLVNTLSNIFTQMGGKLSLNDPIKQLVVKNKKISAVRLETGKFEQSDIVISNLSTYQIKTQLSVSNLTSQTPFSMRNFGCSFFTLNLITEHHPSHEILARHNIFLPEKFQETMNEIFRKKVIPTTPWMYLSDANQFDNIKAKKQELDILFIIVQVPNLTSRIQWDKSALSFKNFILETLEKTLPGLRKRIIHELLTTPQDFGKQFNLAFGTNFQPAIRTPYQNLFYVGENAWQGYGLVGALTAAEEIANIIHQEN